MKTLAQYLTINRIKEQFWPKLLSAELIVKDDEIYVNTKYKGDRKSKSSKAKQKDNSSLADTINQKDASILEIEFKANLALSLTEQHETYVATDMLIEGYVLIEIEGGWLVNGGEETYQIYNEECSCGDFVYRRNQSSRCKHLIFRDWSLNYRARSNRIRRTLK